MKIVTIRVPERKKESDPIQVERFDWKDGSLKGVRAKKRTLPAEAIDPGLEKCLTGAATATECEAMGKKLFEGLMGSSTLELDTRLYLAVEDPKLKELPWEVMKHGTPLARTVSQPLIRCRTKELDSSTAFDRRPLRVLVLVGVRPGDAPGTDPLGARAETSALKLLFRRYDHVFDFDLIDARIRPIADVPALTELFEECRPDIFHFIGHGTPAGLQIYSKATGKEWTWQTERVREVLQNSRTALRLAYLNACQTANGLRLENASSANVFLEHAEATIAMQADVDGQSAASCASDFYEGLAEGKTIDEALQIARSRRNHTKKDCYLPSLWVKSPVERIIRPRASDPLFRDLENCEPSKKIGRHFVDRHTDRRSLMDRLFCSTVPEETRFSAAIITGPPECGKTWLSWWVLRMCTFQRIPACYAKPPNVELENANWLEYVRSICKGNPRMGSLAPPLPAKVVEQFYWELAQVAQGKDAPYGNAPKGTQDTAGPLTKIKSDPKAGNAIDTRVLSCFHKALRQAAGDERMVLVCDGWRDKDGVGLGESDFLILKNGLFDPIAEERGGKVSVVVVLPGADQDPYQNATFDHRWHKVRLTAFDKRSAGELLTEYFEKRWPELSTEEFQAWNQAAGDLAPAEFLKLAEMAGQLRGGRA